MGEELEVELVERQWGVRLAGELGLEVELEGEWEWELVGVEIPRCRAYHICGATNLALDNIECRHHNSQLTHRIYLAWACRYRVPLY